MPQAGSRTRLAGNQGACTPGLGSSPPPDKGRALVAVGAPRPLAAAGVDGQGRGLGKASSLVSRTRHSGCPLRMASTENSDTPPQLPPRLCGRTARPACTPGLSVRKPGDPQQSTLREGPAHSRPRRSCAGARGSHGSHCVPTAALGARLEARLPARRPNTTLRQQRPSAVGAAHSELKTASTPG